MTLQSLPSLDFAPWRLSGVVYGVLLNDPATIQALGDAASQPPYKGAPKAPVLFVKPRNTFAGQGDALVLPQGVSALEVGASIGLVIGRSACRVDETSALEHVAGLVLMADVCLPHESYYRPSVRLRARDGFCPIGPVVPLSEGLHPDRIALTVSVDGKPMQSLHTDGRVRSAARLIADVSEFMTLSPGDVLLTGIPHGAPQVQAGQRVTIEAAGIGRLENHVVREGDAQ